MVYKATNKTYDKNNKNNEQNELLNYIEKFNSSTKPRDAELKKN